MIVVVGVLTLFLRRVGPRGGAIVNWQIAAIGLLGLIALSDFITPLLKPSPTFCHWRRWLPFMSRLGL